jgi:geranylgeranyl diphosphate synthase, type I
MTAARQTYKPNSLPYLQLIEAGVAQFANNLRTDLTHEHPYVREAMESYLSILEAGGKRVRGSLTICGYEMHDGSNTELISLIAGIIEGLHAYLLVIDDIADRAGTRRGIPSAHIAMGAYLRKRHTALNVKQTAADMVISGALVGQHKAQYMLANLDFDQDQKIRVLSIMNNHLTKTGLGQILDMSAAIGIPMSAASIKSIALSKTAYYTFQMPLEVGSVLAGAPESSILLLKKYSLHAGYAFQLQDDIMGVFGDEKKMGKSVKSDIIEGKQTLLVVYAMEKASKTQQNFLKKALGNPKLSDKDFEECQDIMVSTGALDKVGRLANEEVSLAHEILDNAPSEWPTKHVEYLRHLASFAADRDT